MTSKKPSLGNLLGMGIGIILAVTPEPVTTLVGVSMIGYTAYAMGWLGKGD